MSTEVPELDRDALLALLDRMLRAEAVTDAPPAAERGDWLYGSAGFTDPTSMAGWLEFEQGDCVKKFSGEMLEKLRAKRPVG